MDLNLSQLKLRQKLLLLLLIGSSLGLVAITLVMVTANQEMFGNLLPRHEALHNFEIESLALSRHYRAYVISADEESYPDIESALRSNRQRLQEFSETINSRDLVPLDLASIATALDDLERAGQRLHKGRRELNEVFRHEDRLEQEIEQAFSGFLSILDREIGIAIEAQDWEGLIRKLLPELRMVKSINTQILGLFLRIRDYQVDSREPVQQNIAKLKEKLKFSMTLLNLNIENSSQRAQVSSEVVVVYDRLLQAIDQFIRARTEADIAIEQVGLRSDMLASNIDRVIDVNELEVWKNLRLSLIISALILVATLCAGYLLIYFGLKRTLQPIVELQEKIALFGAGELQQRVEVHNADEIGQLGASFNQMADQLGASTEQKQNIIVELEHKNTELEGFTYTVSHELKSPLVTINGFLGLLNKDMQNDDSVAVQRDMDKIEQAVKTMSRQLDDLLELSRIGRVINPPEAISLNEVCDQVLSSMQGIISESEAQIEIADAMPAVYADNFRLREIMQNLIENAIKFSRVSGRPEIKIEATRLGGMALCRVRDNGPGVEPQFHERVFKLFDRLDPRVAGTGIGLALVKKIVEIHGGEIWIEGNGNRQGACFCFTLPTPGEKRV